MTDRYIKFLYSDKEEDRKDTDMLWFVHMQSSILTAKIQNQIVAPEKSL